MTHFKIETKNNIPKGYIGMNKLAAKAHKIPFNHNENVIEIKKGLPKKVRKHTIAHEEAEVYKMKQLIKKGYSAKKAYKEAHYNFALPYEKLEKRFPTEKIKQILKKAGVVK